jgi:uncharacterized protein
MLRLDDASVVLSATDITDYLACDHLFEQRRAVAFGERSRPRPADDPHAALTREKGDEHERAVLGRLTAQLGPGVEFGPQRLWTREALAAAAGQTVQAMRDGAPLIFQGVLFDGRWQGRVDILRRIDGVDSAFGAHAYEVIDTKLARDVKPAFVHQLALYTRLLARVQGWAPPYAHVILGDGREERVELARYAALHRHVSARVEAAAAGLARPTYPEPVAHCGFCALAGECTARRRADDHLSLVAGARREQRERLVDLGLATVAALAAGPDDLPVGRLGADRYALLRTQAALQVASRTTGKPTHRHLPPSRARGYAALPAADPGDVFFDLEGDPYVGDGIEYLWGWTTADGAYEHVWAHDADAEKDALERFVDLVVARRAAHPDLHVFHYAPHEASKLKTLALKYATREEEVDALLREGVLVDLYAVVRQALQVGEESYSIKRLERHHGFVRHEKTVREGGGSIIAYETWLEHSDDTLLEAIRAYNEEDCRSTAALRDWLLDTMRPEAAAELGVDFADLVEPAPEESHAAPEWLADQLALAAALGAGLSADEADDTPDQAARRLLAHLLLYHWREAKPEWWRHFALKQMAPAELVDERDAVAFLRRDPDVPPAEHRRSWDYAFTFPEQEVKLKCDTLLDPTTGAKHNVVAVGDGRLTIRRGKTKPPPAPVALIGDGPIRTVVLREALAELARAADDAFPVARSLLRADPPRLRSGAAFRSSAEPSIAEMNAAALDLDGSHLAVQGPPGTGKTYRGARMIVAALADGLRVGVTAQSHAAIHNLLEAVEEHARDEQVAFAGFYKGDDYTSLAGCITVEDDNAGVTDDHALVAGTAWLFARPEHRERFDLIFVDEAGQFALANAAAVALAARRGLVLLGDPQQLPQVTQAQHPGRSGRSALEHLFAGSDVVPPDRGFFLPESWRMHPDVTAFVSERSYRAQLFSRAACANRAVTASGALAGTGLRVVAVDHGGNAQRSVEEAEAIGAACRALLADGRVTDDAGETRDLAPADVLVVAPYNLAVDCIRAHVPAGVEVGTVDRFQGREAPVVFYAMTCSTGADVPRGLEFLFSRNRLNVAISRAQCLAVLVCSPRLLDANAPHLEAMELIDGVCRFAELALPVPATV